MPVLNIENWGLMLYALALVKQDELLQKVIEAKLHHRDDPANYQQAPDNYLVYCEHLPVYTLGNKGKLENLLASTQDLATSGIEVVKTRRGGDITYHGPGQLIVYPILDLDQFFTDIHKYLRLLEETVIRTLEHLGIPAARIEGLTGVWVGLEDELNARKICAIGVRCSRWVTQHGLALNVNTNLDHFKGIVPCGIQDRGVTSIEKELGHQVSLIEVINIFEKQFLELFMPGQDHASNKTSILMSAREYGLESMGTSTKPAK